MRMNSGTKYIFAAACIGMFLFGVTMVSLGSILLNYIGKYNLSELLQYTHITSSRGILAGSVLFGPITDRYGYKYLMIVCTIFIISALEGLAFTQKLCPSQTIYNSHRICRWNVEWCHKFTG